MEASSNKEWGHLVARLWGSLRKEVCLAGIEPGIREVLSELKGGLFLDTSLIFCVCFFISTWLHLSQIFLFLHYMLNSGLCSCFSIWHHYLQWQFPVQLHAIYVHLYSRTVPLDASDWLTTNQVFKTCSVPPPPKVFCPICHMVLCPSPASEVVKLELLASPFCFSQPHPLGFALHYHTHFSPRASVLMYQMILSPRPRKFIVGIFLYSPPRICICLKQTHFLLLLVLIRF